MLQYVGKKLIAPDAANQLIARYFLLVAVLFFCEEVFAIDLVFVAAEITDFSALLPLIFRSRIDSFFTSSTVLEARYPVPSHHRQFSLSPLQVQGMVSIFDPFNPTILLRWQFLTRTCSLSP